MVQIYHKVRVHFICLVFLFVMAGFLSCSVGFLYFVTSFLLCVVSLLFFLTGLGNTIEELENKENWCTIQFRKVKEAHDFYEVYSIRKRITLRKDYAKRGEWRQD